MQYVRTNKPHANPCLEHVECAHACRCCGSVSYLCHIYAGRDLISRSRPASDHPAAAAPTLVVFNIYVSVTHGQRGREREAGLYTTLDRCTCTNTHVCVRVCVSGGQVQFCPVLLKVWLRERREPRNWLKFRRCTQLLLLMRWRRSCVVCVPSVCYSFGIRLAPGSIALANAFYI